MRRAWPIQLIISSFCVDLLPGNRPDWGVFQVIAERRKQCETSDCDPLVWTNQRLVTWAKSIDLAEYADNLKGKNGAGLAPSVRDVIHRS